MDRVRVAEAVEAGARALHGSLRDPVQYEWGAMSEEWRDEMRSYVRPAIVAALAASDAFLMRAKARQQSVRPRLVSVSR